SNYYHRVVWHIVDPGPQYRRCVVTAFEGVLSMRLLHVAKAKAIGGVLRQRWRTRNWGLVRPSFSNNFDGSASFITVATLIIAGSTSYVVEAEGEKIIWADVHSKKVAVHEKRLPSAATSIDSVSGLRRYPYVILGYGVAGRAALSSLLEHDPTARVLVVDGNHDIDEVVTPSIQTVSNEIDHGGKLFARLAGGENGKVRDKDYQRSNIDFLRGVRVRGLDADRGVVCLGPDRTEDTEKSVVVGFDRCLLALGCSQRKAPPRYIDPSAKGFVVPVSSDKEMRERLRGEVKAGKGVTVIGSAWEALELVCWLREETQARDAGFGSSLDPGGTAVGSCHMVFPDFSPLDHLLPRYLLRAVLKRINSRGVNTLGHSSVRWVGTSHRKYDPVLRTSPDKQGNEGDVGDTAMEADTETVQGQEQFTPIGEDRLPKVGSGAEPGREVREATSAYHNGRLHVMTSQTYDHLDTAMHCTDHVILAGLDSAPISSLVELQGGFETDDQSGAIFVNSELMATSRVWVAGDAANFPSPLLGRRVVRSADHAHHSGLIAGRNMAMVEKGNGANCTEGGSGDGRSDGGSRCYSHLPAFVGEVPLAGVRLAMVGECNAAFTTHAFWWTNQAIGLRRKNTRRHNGDGGTPLSAMRRNSTRSGKAHFGDGFSSRGHSNSPGGDGNVGRSSPEGSRRYALHSKGFVPVYGTGVVFYTVEGKVKGAMLWGFPTREAVSASRGSVSVSEQGGTAVMPETEATTVGSGLGRGAAESQTSMAESSAALSARGVDLLRQVIARSHAMEPVNLSDDRVMAAWVQGLSDAARSIVSETALTGIKPLRRSVAGRVSASKRRLSLGDTLMFEDSGKTTRGGRDFFSAYQASVNENGNSRGDSL
ncbi:unnamed protein product, partial [Choristocarpus tenellus]